jgi:hypothetical protein
MSNTEPTDVGPAAGGDRAISEADRQHVITLLTAAHAEGRLSVPERDRRLEEAHGALIFDDLVPLTRDLVTATPNQVQYAAANDGHSDQIVAIFGGVERAGHWSVRAHTFISVMFGGAELDLSEAVFDDPEISFEVFCLFGGVELKVPEGTVVDNRLIAIFGGCDHKVSPPIAGAPRLVLKGFVGFGGVEVRNPKSVRSRRDRSQREQDRLERRRNRHYSG